MGGVSNVVNAGLGMVTGGLAGPLVDRVGGAIWGGNTSQARGTPSPYSQAPIQQRSMAPVQLSPFIQQYLAARQQGRPFQQLPVGQTVQPLAWRPQYSQPIQQVPYQNMGMFGQYNPFMPRR